MKHNAVVTETEAELATVSVLREEACSHCAGRVVCGTAKRFSLKVKNPVSARVGDTVVIENRSERVLAYSALVFLAPVLLGLIMYFIFNRYGMILTVCMTVIGFVLPFIAAFIVDKIGRNERLPVIVEILTADGDQAVFDNCGEHKEG